MLKPGLQRLIFTVVILALLLALANFTLRQPIHDADLPKSFSSLASYLENQDSLNSTQTMQEVKDKWEQVRMRILLNAGFDSLLIFESAMARLEIAINEEAFLAAQLELAQIREIWREFITF